MGGESLREWGRGRVVESSQKIGRMRPSHPLTAEQELEAGRIEDISLATARAEAKQIAQVLASKSNGALFGQTEFEVRDHVHRIGARTIEAVLDKRQKGGAVVPRRCAGSATSGGSSCSTSRGV